MSEDRIPYTTPRPDDRAFITNDTFDLIMETAKANAQEHDTLVARLRGVVVELRTQQLKHADLQARLAESNPRQSFTAEMVAHAYGQAADLIERALVAPPG